ncbi:hypothetical protein L5D93_09950 [Paenibacillus thiaminolyticus]|nr:hypothetical protein [Paenibacillus thiaminolyticus]
MKRNRFYNNAAYDLILYDGQGAHVEENYFGSTNKFGLAVSAPFADAVIVNNHFDGSKIVAENDAVFTGNKMNDSIASFLGPNIQVNGMTLTDAVFRVDGKEKFGVKVSELTIYNNKKRESGLIVNGMPSEFRNVKIIGESTLRVITGNAPGGSVFHNLQVLEYNSTYGLSLPLERIPIAGSRLPTPERSERSSSIRPGNTRLTTAPLSPLLWQRIM